MVTSRRHSLEVLSASLCSLLYVSFSRFPRLFTVMAPTSRLLKSLTRLVFPTLLLIIVAVAAGSVWLVYSASRPVKTTYLVTPDKYGRLSTRAAQITNENWQNRDGSSSHGWVLRGI